MEAARLPHWRGGHAWGMKANKREWRTARSWGSSVAVGHGGTRTNQRVPLRSREQQPYAYSSSPAARSCAGALLPIRITFINAWGVRGTVSSSPARCACIDRRWSPQTATADGAFKRSVRARPLACLDVAGQDRDAHEMQTISRSNGRQLAPTNGHDERVVTTASFAFAKRRLRAAQLVCVTHRKGRRQHRLSLSRSAR